MTHTHTCRFTTVLCALVLASSLGCNSSDQESGDAAANGMHDDHAHHPAAPHGGHLIDLGRNHEYHAELVEDDATEQVTVYILDHDMKPTVADDDSLVMTVTVDGQTTSYDLATPAEGADGHRTQYTASDGALFRALHDTDEATGKLRISIGGAPYVGELAHDHHHEGDDHDHEAHAGEHPHD